jgi:two-component system response regulator MprA
MQTTPPTVDVLVVDDSPASAETLATAISMDGYRVEVCTEAAQALESIARLYPLCVLLDFGMPGVDGLDIVKAVRERFGDSIVIILCTGWELQQPRVAEASALVDHYFTKPVSLEKLRQILPPVADAAGHAA